MMRKDLFLSGILLSFLFLDTAAPAGVIVKKEQKKKIDKASENHQLTNHHPLSRVRISI